MNYSKLECWRTRDLSPVGLLPAALQGFEIDNIFSSAKTCDELNRNLIVKLKPSRVIALRVFFINNAREIIPILFVHFKISFFQFLNFAQSVALIEALSFNFSTLIILWRWIIGLSIWLPNINTYFYRSR